MNIVQSRNHAGLPFWGRSEGGGKPSDRIPHPAIQMFSLVILFLFHCTGHTGWNTPGLILPLDGAAYCSREGGIGIPVLSHGSNGIFNIFYIGKLLAFHIIVDGTDVFYQ